MKRDMDLIRDILKAIEDGKEEFTPGDPLEGSDATPDAVIYHLNLLEQAGLVDVLSRELAGATYIGGLTWAGHDFLDTVRDPEVWRKTKSGAGKVGGLAFDLLKDLATTYVKQEAKKHLGIDL